MAINKKKFLEAIKKGVNKYTPIGVAKQMSAYTKDKAAEKKSKANLKKLNRKAIIQSTQKRYKKKYGENMSPSALKADLTSGMLGKQSKDYLKMKKEETKRRVKKY